MFGSFTEPFNYYCHAAPNVSVVTNAYALQMIRCDQNSSPSSSVIFVNENENYQ